jgi:hypothetical protein
MSIDEISQSVAEVVLELMEDSIDWRISDCYPNTEGDEYNAIHQQVMQRAIEIMYKQNTEANIGGPAGISNDENVLDADHASL